MTSLSDIPLVHQSCEEALAKEEAWDYFRSLPGFLYAIENFPESSHRALIEAVPVEDLTTELFAGDIGAPPRIKLPDGREISPSMLRYAAISRDLGRRFQINSANIVEIGCGFGGQYKVLSDHYERGVYYGFDTPPMIGVAGKYLEHFGLGAYGLYDHIADGALFLKPLSPLLISNYALSEMRRDVQEMYFDNIIRHCPMGYVHWNNPKRDFDSMDVVEFMERLSVLNVSCVSYDEECVPIDPNVTLVTWGGGECR